MKLVSSLCGHNCTNSPKGRERAFLLWKEVDCRKCHNVQVHDNKACVQLRVSLILRPRLQAELSS